MEEQTRTRQLSTETLQIGSLSEIASSAISVQSVERFGVFIGFTLLYLATLSQNLSITHDSILYLYSITTGDPHYHANHLLYEHFGVLISQILCAIGIIGFSYGVWYYSTAIEIYIFQLALLMLCFKFLLSRNATLSTFVTCAIIHSAAVLLHESSILFGVVPVVAICCLPQRTWAEKFRTLFVYLVVCAILVGGSYLLAAHSLDKLNSFEQFIYWAAGNGTQEEWSGLTLRSMLLAVVGFARALVSFSFLFSISEMQSTLASMFPANNLTDEVYLVRNIQSSVAVLLAVAVIALSGMLALLAMVSVCRLMKAGLSYQLLLVLSWLVPTTVFFVAFNPSNVDFWIVALLLGIVIIAAGAAHRSRGYNYLFATAVALVFLSNFVGVILPASDNSNDYNRQLISHYASYLSEEDVLVIADDWPIVGHLNYYDRPTLTFLRP